MSIKLHKSIINNDDERLENTILHLKFRTAKRKYFFELYEQFGHTLSESFASPSLVQLLI
jgi:hypothetical protein